MTPRIMQFSPVSLVFSVKVEHFMIFYYRLFNSVVHALQHYSF